MRDMRSVQIKKLLREQYPSEQFRVHINKFAYGEAIVIKTTLWPETVEMDCYYRRLALRQYLENIVEPFKKWGTSSSVVILCV